MSGHNYVTPIFERTSVAYSVGMDDTVVDVVVIRWIMQKLNFDRMKHVLRRIATSSKSDERS